MIVRRNQKLWIRVSNFVLTTTGVSNGAVSVQGLRDQSVTGTGGGNAQLGLEQEFTVVRFIGTWQLTITETAAGTVTGNPASIIGARTGTSEELEEFLSDPVFRLESGPVLDPLTDWMLWNPVHAGNGVSGNFGSATGEAFVGRGMFDIRSSRRVDSIREDFIVFLNNPANATGTLTTTLNLSYQALCVIP